MTRQPILAFIKDHTQKSLWSLRNVIGCIPDGIWRELFCGTPLYKHVYHTLHSLDRWYINPYDYNEPDFHADGLSDLNLPAKEFLSRDMLNNYADQVETKIHKYLDTLTEEALSEKPKGCGFTRFELILAQHRHLDMHIGMLMGYIIAETGKWPKVLGLMDEIKERKQCEYD
jgi:hypothetical protein